MCAENAFSGPLDRMTECGDVAVRNIDVLFILEGARKVATLEEWSTVHHHYLEAFRFFAFATTCRCLERARNDRALRECKDNIAVFNAVGCCISNNVICYYEAFMDECVNGIAEQLFC